MSILNRALWSSVVIAAWVGQPARAQVCPTGFQSLNFFTADADIAVGRTQVVVIDHDRVRVFDKCGQPLAFLPPLGQDVGVDGLVINGYDDAPASTHPGLFTLAGAVENGFDVLNDPEVHGDPLTRRFFAMACRTGAVGVPPIAQVYIGYSMPDDATDWYNDALGVPTMKQIDVETCAYTFIGTHHLPNLAIDESDVWFTSTLNGTTHPTCFDTVVIGRIDKAQFLSNPQSPDITWLSTNWFFDGGGVLARNQSFDAAPQYAVGFVSESNNPQNTETSMTFRVRAVKYVPGGALGQILTSAVDVQFTAPATCGASPIADLSQPNPTAPKVRVFPSEQIWHVTYRNGSLWFAYVRKDCVTGRPVVRWFEIKTNGWDGGPTNLPFVHQAGIVTPPGTRGAFVPSMGVLSDSSAAVTFGAVGESSGEYASIWAAYRCVGDTLGTMRAPFELYNHNAIIESTLGILSCADYSGTTSDPSVRSRIWTHHGVTSGPIDTSDPFYVPSRVHRFDLYCNGIDVSGNGLIDLEDTAAFAAFLGLGAPEADFEPDGEADASDVEAYLEIGGP